ncbi:hypothetical protein [Tumidithrix helvetica]|uniref:hypothetical protein n=1 Tax=Tumidithrix helvetica TaxID=3457545 RepID=UPI003CC6104A
MVQVSNRQFQNLVLPSQFLFPLVAKANFDRAQPMQFKAQLFEGHWQGNQALHAYMPMQERSLGEHLVQQLNAPFEVCHTTLLSL